MSNAAATTIQALVITTLAGVEYRLMPVSMSLMPSRSSEEWLKFQGRHISGGGLAEDVQDKVQAYMRRHQTEALFDGQRNLTLAGNSLAVCFPEKFGPVPANEPRDASMTQEIKLDGVFLIKGDPVSIGVIWNNLSGANFSGLSSRPDFTYEDYLKMVEHGWKCDLKAGGVLTLHQVGSSEHQATHTIQR
ncbi:TPA: hypothetical protein ACKRQV_001225 [Pseudomonas aeruginosa]|nr:hypothetical protein [Pseudomonas aeruginosa]EIU2864426.1 hypothetical protein [Pseudomonas aeruginosa]